jgi:hypothetical protein
LIYFIYFFFSLLLLSFIDAAAATTAASPPKETAIAIAKRIGSPREKTLTAITPAGTRPAPPSEEVSAGAFAVSKVQFGGEEEK